MSANPFDWQQRQARRANASNAPPPYSTASSDAQPNGRASPRHASFADSPRGGQAIPPPPLGSAMKRDGSRSRVPHLRPEFPDERSYLGSTAPDLERKNRPTEKKFRDKRDGYESEEGEMHRKSTKGKKDKSHRDDPYQDGGRRPNGRDAMPYDEPPRQRRPEPTYDDDSRRHRAREGDVEAVRPPRHSDRRRRDAYSDESDSDADRRPRRRPTRRNDYSDESDSDAADDRRRRRRSTDDRAQRSSGKKREDKYDPDSRDARKRREEIYDRDREARRSDRRPKTYSDDEGYDKDGRRRERDARRPDRRSRAYSDDDGYDRDGRRRDPKPIMVGKYDIGPYVEKGQKHYKTFAPIVTPIVMNMAKTYMAQKGGGRR